MASIMGDVLLAAMRALSNWNTMLDKFVTFQTEWFKCVGNEWIYQVKTMAINNLATEAATSLMGMS